MRNLSEAHRGHLAMLLFSALVAGSFSLGAMAAPFVDPVALTIARFFIAGIVIAIAVFLTTGVPKGSFSAPWRYLILGGLYVIYFVLMFEGLKTAPAVSAAAVFTLTPVMAGGFGYLLLRQITTARMALALAIGATGALWVIFRADVAALLAFQIGKGELIYFWGCVAHALYIPMVRVLNRGEPAIVFSLGAISGGFVILLLIGWRSLIETDWSALPMIVWIALIYVAVAASAMTFVLIQYASLRLPAAKVMAYTYLTPSWVILWEIALGHGVPPVFTLAGIALTVVALLMLLKGDA